MTKRLSQISKIFFVFLCIAGLGLAILGKSGCNTAYAQTCFSLETTPPPIQSKELASHYYEFTPQVLEQSLTQGKVVLYFWAPWCSTCTSLDSDLQSKKVSVPDGVTILRLDYDHAKELKVKYQVVAQHTFVQVDAHGEPLNIWVGGDMSAFSSHLQ